MPTPSLDSFGTRRQLRLAGAELTVHSLPELLGEHSADVPYCTKILLENLLRHEDGVNVTAADIELLAGRDRAPADGSDGPGDIAFSPERILMQDFTGVPCIADLGAIRDAVAALGGDPSSVDPVKPVDLVIDHSIQVDQWADAGAMERNLALDLRRNGERYEFLARAQDEYSGLRVVPPNTGICHQVNLEHLATVVTVADGVAFPDSVVGTDSHTPMVNGIGVVGWGVGGIEAEAAMLGEPISMQVPLVVGVRLDGALRPGVTATDLVLTLAERLRRHGVVGKFVELHGDGLASLSVPTRATIGNMSPEFGATISIFPIDGATTDYLTLTGRSAEHVALVEAYARAQGLWSEPGAQPPSYDETMVLDLAEVEASVAGPARPQDRMSLRDLPGSTGVHVRTRAFDHQDATDEGSVESFPASDPPAPGHAVEVPASPPPSSLPPPRILGRSAGPSDLHDGDVVIAAITSCTNTSNPDVMLAAGLLARNAVQRGLRTKPWVKTSLAPGSRVVVDYLEAAGLTGYLDQLGFQLVGYGCTTCIGNSGPLSPEVSTAIAAGDLDVSAVLSGNRNFEGRIHPEVRSNYLASPPLVVAFALAGTVEIDLTSDPLGDGTDGPVHLADVWPSADDIAAAATSITPTMFRDAYDAVFGAAAAWHASGAGGPATSVASTYVRRPPFLDGLAAAPSDRASISGARILALLGETVTTDHISPAGSIAPGSPAAEWLEANGVPREDFNSYGSRRGNHEVMVRGTFANVRIRNRLAGSVEGGVTRHLPSGHLGPIYDVAMRYREDGVPLVVVAGSDYGTGSSRDWAAKGTALLGVRAVIAESFERIHRSNLIGMGVLPLQLIDARATDFTGTEVIDVVGGDGGDLGSIRLLVDGAEVPVRPRVDTAAERTYLAHGGILPYIARRFAGVIDTPQG